MTTLTNLVHQAGALLLPIEAAQRRSILESSVLAMDKTPIRAGRSPGVKGKMQGAYFWPMYGASRRRAAQHVCARWKISERRSCQGYC